MTGATVQPVGLYILHSFKPTRCTSARLIVNKEPIVGVQTQLIISETANKRSQQPSGELTGQVVEGKADLAAAYYT
ncbi:hypothetical protein Bpfe_010884 [Biomphalaria pfeifferi]|uniref:Uncharacterized protein n=1 Tax=Biomphalaria pfeifferi TaxID=112525 RepID=A0AAD8BSB0_BIOPF|nr:hypothetical protein Bpfe_010884 [Biomphalaria pfeifferi]